MPKAYQLTPTPGIYIASTMAVITRIIEKKNFIQIEERRKARGKNKKTTETRNNETTKIVLFSRPLCNLLQKATNRDKKRKRNSNLIYYKQKLFILKNISNTWKKKKYAVSRNLVSLFEIITLLTIHLRREIVNGSLRVGNVELVFT